MKHLHFTRLLSALTACAMILALMSGCWDASEINGRAFVIGFGADEADDGGYRFSFQMAVPVSGGSDSESAIEYVTCTIKDDSVASAIRTLEKNFGRQINFEQLTSIIIGESLSKQNFAGIMELFFRRASVRRQSCIAVCRGSAESLLQTETTGQSVSSDIAISLQSYDSDSGTTSMAMKLYTLYTSVSNGDSFYLLQVSEVNSDSEQNVSSSDASVSSSGNGSTLEISGALAYSAQGDYLGDVDSNELEMMRLVTNSQTSGIISSAGTTDATDEVDENDSEESGDRLYYQIKSSSCNSYCEISDDAPEFTINLSVQCSLVEGYGMGDNGMNTEDFNEFAEKCIVRELTDELVSIAYKSRSELGASILGLQKVTRQTEADWYEQNYSDWEQIYSESEITINVSCEVTGGGLTQ